VNVGLDEDHDRDVDDNEGDKLDYAGGFVSSTPMLDDKNMGKNSHHHHSFP
jgi:hypothetical protein